MQSKRKFLAGSFAAALFVAAPFAANAFTIDSTTPTNQTFEVSWELMGSDASNPVGTDLTGNAQFEYLGVTGANDSQLLFGLTLTNTTITNTSGGFGNIGLTAFGFGTDSNFSIASWGGAGSGGTGGSSGGGGTSGVVDVDPNDPAGALGGLPDFNNPGPGGAVVECKDDPNNINESECITVLAVAVADPNDPGLLSGDSETFEFVLDLNQVVSSTTQVTVSPFAVAYDYDTVGLGGGQKGGSVQIAAASQVPVPGTLLLLGAGALMASRKRAKR